MLDQHRKEMHEQFSQILSMTRKSRTHKPEAPTFAITNRSGVSTRDPPFPTPSKSTHANHTKGATEKEGPEVLEMDKDELVQIILAWPFLATARAAIDVHEGKLSLRVGSETSPSTLENP
uniref:Reverse transcriptase domain-containing protein n=1 Tax=Tanacetum cinerariifolium TaxID=118510 RepID=A0A6L2KLY0_TANCI|nr:hypothetical protein [Tanacetum cinerariifolium]